MMEQNKQPDWMTLAEVCIYWRVSRSTARRYIKDLGIQKHSLGGSQNIRYRREDIEGSVRALETLKT